MKFLNKILAFFHEPENLEETEINIFERPETLLMVFNEKIQNEIFEKYQIQVPLHMVFCTKEKFYNSPLYFEMWQPEKQFINK